MKIDDLLEKEIILNSKISLKEKDHAGIYFLISENNIVYVGISKHNCFSRIHSHEKDKVFDSYFILPCKDPDKREILESLYIFKYHPKYNKTLNTRPTKKYIHLGLDLIGPARDRKEEQTEFHIIGNHIFAKDLSFNINKEEK